MMISYGLLVIILHVKYLGKKSPSILGTQRFPHLLQQSIQFLQLSLGKIPHQLLVQGEKGFIQVGQRLGAEFGDGDKDHPSITLTALAVNVTGLLQPIDQAGDTGNDRDSAISNLK